MKSSTTYRTTSSVRRVSAPNVYHMAEDDNHYDLTIFSLHENDTDTESLYGIRMVCSHGAHGRNDGLQTDCIMDTCSNEQTRMQHQPVVFDMSLTDHDENWTREPCMHEVLHLRTVNCDPSETFGTEMEIILDSGADISCLPLQFAQVGHESSGGRMVFRDASGNQMQQQARRRAEVSLGDAVFSEDFLVTSVSQPLLAVGKLVRAGWSIEAGPTGSTTLTNGKHRIPVFYRKNSLSVFGCVRAVNACDDNSDVQMQEPADSFLQDVQPSSQSTGDALAAMFCPDPDLTGIKTIRSVSLSQELADLGGTWTQVNEQCWALKSFGSSFVDVSANLPAAQLRFRTTLVYVNSEWQMIEFGTSIESMVRADCEIPELEGPSPLITFGCKVMMSCEQMGFTVLENEFHGLTAADVQETLPDEMHQPSAPSGLNADGSEPLREEPEGPETPSAEEVERADLAARDVNPEVPASLTIDDITVTSDSPLRDLREACRLWGLGKSGGKATIYDRLVRHWRMIKLKEQHQVMLQGQAEQAREPLELPLPKMPSADAVKKHVLTHLPFAPWCQYCTQYKARDRRHQGRVGDMRSRSVISMDFCYTGRHADQREEPAQDEDHPDEKTDKKARKLVTLVLHDRQTRFLEAIPVEQKGTQRWLRYLCKEVCRFASMLGYNDVVLKSDSEPTMRCLQEMVTTQRLQVGMSTKNEYNASQDHASNGAVEQAIQSLRQQAQLLLQQYEDGAQVTVQSTSPIHSWAWKHAAFLLNRYNAPDGQTAFERAFQMPYSGSIVQFGEAVFARVQQRSKGDPRFIRGLWLTKLASNDAHCVVTAGGQLVASRTIKRTPAVWDKSLDGALTQQSWCYPGLMSGLVVFAKPATLTAKPVETFVPLHDDGAPLESLLSDELVVNKEIVVQDEAASDPPSSPAERRNSSTSESTSDAEASNDPGFFQSVLEPVGEDMEVTTSAPAASSSRAADADPVDERPHKQAKIDSAKRARLAAPPVHAGNVGMVTKELTGVCMIGGEALGHADEPSATAFAEEDLEFLEAYDDSWEFDQMTEDIKPSKEEAESLYFPGGAYEPELAADALQDVDNLADRVEISRLVDMGALEPLAPGVHSLPDHRHLGARFVRTWRPKMVGNELKQLRRSRIVAKEFAWLDPDREHLFAPASSSTVSRIIPALFVHNRTPLVKHQEQFHLMSMDVRDAYLTCAQKHKTVVTLEVDSEKRSFALHRCIPGQRDGSSNWWTEFTEYITACAPVESCVENPSLFNVVYADGFASFLMHVDDFLFAGHPWILQRIADKVQERYEVTVEWVRNVGDELTFLKRTHVLMNNNRLGIRPHSKHIEQLELMLGVETCKPRKTPAPVGNLPTDSMTQALDGESAHIYRSAVGVLLYMSHDVFEAQYCIRLLAQHMAQPTSGSYRLLVHLVCYLKGVKYRTLTLETPTIGKGFVTKSPGGEHLLEAYSDADWSGCKQTRRSVTGMVLMWNNVVLTSASRTQKSVSLSSAESEFNAAVSTACDALYIRNNLRFLLGTQPVFLRLLSDSSACRGVVARQGSGKIKHLEGKLLWIQSKARAGEISCAAVSTAVNVADLMTKALPKPRVNLLLYHLGVADEDGVPVGEAEFTEQQEKLDLKLAIRRVQRDLTDECGLQQSSSSMTLAKRVLRIGMMSSLMVRGAATSQPEDVLSPSPMFTMVSMLNFDFGDVYNFCALVGAAWIVYTFCRLVIWLEKWLCNRRMQPEASCGMRSRSHLVDACIQVSASPQRLRSEATPVATQVERIVHRRIVDRVDNAASSSTLAAPSAAASSGSWLHPQPMVCITTYGRYYHKKHCKWLKQSSGFEQMLEKVALQKGYKQCRTCLHESRVNELGVQGNLPSKVD